MDFICLFFPEMCGYETDAKSFYKKIHLERSEEKIEKYLLFCFAKIQKSFKWFFYSFTFLLNLLSGE